MTANVETMAYTKVEDRDVPWHGLGTPVENPYIPIHEALRLAELDWKVVKQPVFVRRNDTFVQVPDKFELMRDRDEFTLGIVGKDYVPFQNEDALAFIDNLVDGGVGIDTLGALDHGRKVWVAMAVPDHIVVDGVERSGTIQVGGEDPVRLFLLIATSHDGTKAITVAVTPVRVVCQNTLSMGLATAKQRWSVRHIASAGQRLQEARDALRLTFTYTDAFQMEAEAMLAQEMSKEQFRGFANDLLPERPTKEAVVNSLTELFLNSPTLEAVRGTRWAAFNAVSEYIDWREAPGRTTQSRFIATTQARGEGLGLRAKARELLATTS
jgi:phage/plasmid-like protein (TIGR03299 family)